MTVVTLSSKFQVSVPKEVRDALQLKAGQKMVFINTGSSIKLLAQPSIGDLVGIARGASAEGLRERVERRVDRLPAVLPGTTKSRLKKTGSSARTA